MSAAPIPPASALRTKVIHLVTLLELGGAQGNTIHTVRHLDSNHFDAHLWTGAGGYWDAEVKADLGREGRLRFLRHLVRPVSPIQDLLAVVELWRAFRKERPDIVHTHSSKAGIVGRIAARLAGVPVVIHTFHGFGFNDRQGFLTRSIYVALEKWTAGWSSRLIFVSESNWKVAERLAIGNPAQYALIRSGVPLQRLAEAKLAVDRNAVRKGLGLPADTPLVVSISAFKPQKNLKDFVEMASRVSAQAPKAAFLLVGDGEQRPELDSLVRAAGLNDRFFMPGWVSDPMALLAAADAFVLTSLWEGLPRALVEAISLGVPAVCYQADGVSDLLSSEEELRPRGDVGGIAASVIRLLTDSAQARRLAAAQASRVTRDYDIAEMVRQQEMLYLSLSRKTRS